MLPIKKGVQTLLNEGPMSFKKRSQDYIYYRMREIVSSIIELRYDQIILTSDDVRDISTEVYDLDDNFKSLNPKEQKNLNPLDKSEYSKIHLQPIYTFDSSFVAVLSDITTAGVNGLAYTESGKIVGDTVDFDAENEIFTVNRIKRCLSQDIIHNPLLITSLLFTGSPIGNRHHYTHAAILHGKSHTYYQWIIYHLLKIRGIEHYESVTGNSVELLIPSDPPSYVVESLELLGYTPDDYTEWNVSAATIEKLIIPSFPQPTPEAIEWLRHSILSNLETDEKSSGWIYISRQQADKRRIANFEDIKPILHDHDVNIVELETYTLAEQVQIIKNAEGIISPHGAGLTNMIWAEELDIIEIFGDVVDAPFFIMADVLEHNYTAISGTQSNSGEANRDSDIIISPKKINIILKDKTS